MQDTLKLQFISTALVIAVEVATLFAVRVGIAAVITILVMVVIINRRICSRK